MVAVGNRVVVKRVEVQTQTPSGILLPDSAKERPHAGTVVAVGPKVEVVKPGQTVLFSKYGGSEVDINDEEYVVLCEDDIFVILSGPGCTLRTSDEWLREPEFAGYAVIDPDGWDRANLEFSWNQLISLEEFRRRLMMSTVCVRTTTL